MHYACTRYTHMRNGPPLTRVLAAVIAAILLVCMLFLLVFEAPYVAAIPATHWCATADMPTCANDT